eukprot:TRINITY_DN10816_c0_g1_i1.p1 TRINITY_DN10816_c0_g1~~TRINITY_DN10816_c0_g1_i1.p1  ORF type:complete len:405 (+),score=92.66 TRINITY_DN10816_c0_g1_i1:66-1280(+)
MSGDGEPDVKRGKADISTAVVDSAQARDDGMDLSDYTLQPTGWYVSNSDPSWQYHGTLSVLYHATTGQCYRIVQGQLVPVSVNFEQGTVTDIAAVKEPELPAWFKGCNTITSALTSMQGQRPTQEDRHIVDDKFAAVEKCSPQALYAVFDGHLGTEASQYAADHLSQHISAAMGSLTFDSDAKQHDEQLAKIMKDSFLNLDKEFLRIARIRKRRDGACAAVVLFLGRKLISAHLGDSRVVLVAKDDVVGITQDHKPEAEREKRRIEAAGGHVNDVNGVWRVGHKSTEMLKELARKHGPRSKQAQPGLQLAVARSFGDIELKQPTPLLTAEPDVNIRQLEPSDEAVVIACDGVFDVMTNDDVGTLVRDHLTDPDKAAEMIVREAYSKGSTDNISVIVLKLQPCEP